MSRVSDPQQAAQPTPCRTFYRFCDVLLSLRAARPSVIADFDNLYGAFRQANPQEDPNVDCFVDTDEAGRGHVVADRQRRDVPMADPNSAYASWIVWEAVAAASTTHLFLHASAVCLDGYAILFVGPTGRGKSTLARAMVDRGAERLNDDITAVERASGMAEHFPKGEPEARVRPESRRPVGALFLLRSTAPSRALHLAIDRLPAEWETAPPWREWGDVAVRREQGHCEIRSSCAPAGAAELLREACNTAGVTILRDLAVPGPVFAPAPQLRPIPGAAAAPWLAADLFGRGDRPATALAWDLAGAFAAARFWQLIPGPADATAEAMTQALRSDQS